MRFSAEGSSSRASASSRPYDTEGKFEALEFAAGNFGLLESGLRVRDGHDAAPGQDDRVDVPQGPQYVTFQFVNEPSVIRYTIDGSRPNENSTLWDSSGPREPGQVFYVTENTTFRWLATDIKGNNFTGRQEFRIGGS